MRQRIDWLSNLKIVTSKKTGVKRYFIKMCDVWRRVSHSDYKSRENDANRADSFSTVITGDLTHQYKTVYGVHFCKPS